MDMAAVLEKLCELRKVLFGQLDCSPTLPAGTSAMHYCPGQVTHPLMHPASCMKLHVWNISLHAAERWQCQAECLHRLPMMLIR